MTGPAEDALNDAFLEAIVAEVSDLGRKLTMQGQALQDHERILVAVADDVQKLVAARLAAPPVVCWADADRETAARAWADLGSWVNDVLLARYPHVGRQGGARLVAPCWFRHPFAVEEISALFHAWCQTFRDSSASPTAANDWHKRLSEACDRVGLRVKCPPDGHHEDEPAPPADRSGFAAFTAADVESRPVKPPDQQD
jgi:hypothetical protein